MKRLALLLVLAVLALRAEVPPAKPFPACFPAATFLLVRIDAGQLLDQGLVKEVLTAKIGDINAFIGNIRTATGVDLGSITEVWIAVLKKDHAVIVLKGAFDLPTIQGTVLNIDTVQAVQRPGVPLALLLPDEKKPGKSNLAALLDSEKMVFGPPELVDDFLAAYLGEGEGLPPALAERANGMLGGEAMLDALLLKLPPEELRKNPWMTLFTYGQGAVSLAGQDVQFEVALGLRKPEMREPAMKAIEGVRDIYRLLDENMRRLDPLPSMLLEGVTVKPDAELLVLRAALPREVVERLLRQKMGMP
ncbi:MAG: hypothetical protein RBU25_14565 [Lentisphaeria bacterium]|jgi:hypothetical protein|nr:hypothetical protein [Lentisphaeria bacterium]